MAKTVKKVGNNVGAEKVEPKGHIDFPKSAAKYENKEKQIVSAVNAEGLLIAVPKKIMKDDKVAYAGFDMRKHKPLKKTDFTSMATFLEYTAYVARLKAAFFIKIAEDREAKADRLSKFGDEITRKKAAKIARMREQLKALEDQLTADGIDIKDV